MKINKILFLVAASCLSSLFSFSQKPNASAKPSSSGQAMPKLIVGIVVDQMRYDYLYKYAAKYSAGGFKRLLGEGFLCSQANYSYVPTYTAPGHASIYTGTTPSIHGIVENDWYDSRTHAIVYCVRDTTVLPVGTQDASGRMSPHQLMSSTITDELRKSSGMKSKVIGISLKDRSSILPAGHMPNGAFWHDPSTNKWVSSSYYMKELPSWLTSFNEKHRVDSFLSKPWTTLLPISEYTESAPDNNRYEGLFADETSPVFPHNLPAIKLKDTELIRKTPFGNTFTMEAAMAAIRGENLGKGSATDFIAISFSSTDYVGHMFGTQAVELEDTYLRLDRDLAEFLSFLDSWVGKNNVLVFLTADHGAADNALFCEDHQMPGGNLNFKPVADSLEHWLQKNYGAGTYVLNATSTGIYLDHALLTEKKLELETVQKQCAAFLLQFPQIALALPAEELKNENQHAPLASFIERGFYLQRSPDVCTILQPGWMEWFRQTGTTHGSPYSYDTHVPLLFYGWKIQHGSTSVPIDICDIAPTLSELLKLPSPTGSRGKIIPGITK